MSEDNKADISPTRLRVGVLLIFIWWLPIWVFAPQIADFFGFDPNNARIVIMIIQTIIGFFGVLIVGKQVAGIIKGVPFKRMIPTVWGVIRSGKVA